MRYLAVKYVQEIKDRYGRTHLYFRRSGWPRMKLDGLPGSEEFARSYQAALDNAPQKVMAGASSIVPGSISDLLATYYGSSEFKALQPGTRKSYRGILQKLSDDFGDLPVKDISRKNILQLKDAGYGLSFMKRLKTVLNFAVEREFRSDNPADKVRLPKGGEGFRAWTDADIAKFTEFWPSDSRQILALNLLLYTGVRRSDVVKMGWQHVQGDLISVIPQKTSHAAKGAKRLLIPIHPHLAAHLNTIPRTQMMFLMTAYGKQMSPVGFSNWFSESAKKAGLPENSSPHGLRKAAARRLAEAGCTPSQIAAITGHESLKEVERYTASVDQLRLARAAIKKLDANTK